MPPREPALPTDAPARVARPVAFDETGQMINIKQEPLTPRLPLVILPNLLPAPHSRQPFDVIEFPRDFADETIAWEEDDNEENKENISPHACTGCACRCFKLLHPISHIQIHPKL
jgi:hypothetical protein